MNHHTKTTVVCCNPIFHLGSSCMDHRTAFHVRVGLAQACPNNALAICTYNLASKCDIYLWDSNYWCCYYGNKVIHNTCNMAIRDLPDMYALSPQACSPQASGIHMYQANPPWSCYNYYIML